MVFLLKIVCDWREDMENYLNILFIRLRSSGRYIFQRGRQVFEVVELAKVRKRRKMKEKLWRKAVERGWDGERKREYEEETEGWSARRRVVTRRKGRERSGRRCLCLEFITQWYHFVPRRSQATPGTNPGRSGATAEWLTSWYIAPSDAQTLSTSSAYVPSRR